MAACSTYQESVAVEQGFMYGLCVAKHIGGVSCNIVEQSQGMYRLRK
jgi:hypothetical protein